jgi:hypothetical protein
MNALERAYPRIYRATPVQQIFKSAKSLENLDSVTLEAIVALEARYVADLVAINTELAAATRQWEPAEQRLRAEAFAQRMAGMQPEEIQDKTRDLFLRRDDLSRDYTRQLKGILTDEQFAQLPGGYRWADLPSEAKPVNQAMPTGDGAASTQDRGGASSKSHPERPSRGERPDGDSE